jgi:hypothetical protein
LKSILGIFSTATHTNSISYGRIGAKYYFRYMKKYIFWFLAVGISAAALGYIIGLGDKI